MKKRLVAFVALVLAMLMLAGCWGDKDLDLIRLELYYRGISLEDAKVLQMISFIAPVLENIPDEAQREAVAAQFESDIRNIIRNV